MAATKRNAGVTLATRTSLNDEELVRYNVNLYWQASLLQSILK